MDKGDIAYFDLGLPPGGSGHEQSGNRPGIIISNDANDPNNPMVVIIPLTTKSSASRFPFTLLIQSTPSNGLSLSSVALVFQLRAIDKNRLVNVIGQIEANHLNTLKNMVRQLLDL